MCQLVEEYAKEKFKDERRDTVISLLKNGVSIDIIALSVPEIPRKVIEELNDQLKNTI